MIMIIRICVVEKYILINIICLNNINIFKYIVFHFSPFRENNNNIKIEELAKYSQNTFFYYTDNNS